jgi:Protein of unknown function (DUF2442)
MSGSAIPDRCDSGFQNGSYDARHVVVSDDSLTVELFDGRSLSVPLAWYPRLLHGTASERDHWRLIGQGQGIHWPDLDEDVSVDGLLKGHRSGESQVSLKRWLDARPATAARSNA